MPLKRARQFFITPNLLFLEGQMTLRDSLQRQDLGSGKATGTAKLERPHIGAEWVPDSRRPSPGPASAWTHPYRILSSRPSQITRL